jgi:hypothetical protein
VQTADEYLDIPDTEVVDIEVKMPKMATAKYEELKKKSLLDLGDSVVTAASAAVLVNKLVQAAAGNIYDEDGVAVRIHAAKLEALRELALAHQPLLIAANYRSHIDQII